MLDNKIKYILAFFIVLVLSMNAFGATDFTADSSDVAVSSSVSVDKVADNNQADNQVGDGQSGDGQTGDGQSGDGQSGDGQTGDNQNNGNGKQTFNFNGTSFDFNRSSNRSSFNISDILSLFTNLMGGNNSTNATNTTAIANETVAPEVSDVPKVVTSTTYAVSKQPAETQQSQHIVKRVRDNNIVSRGDILKLEGINKLFDSDFTNGHLLVYIDGKLVFNEITTNDLSTPIFGITDSYLGQHQISVEFTSNDDSNGNVNKYTEDVIIE